VGTQFVKMAFKTTCHGTEVKVDIVTFMMVKWTQKKLLITMRSGQQQPILSFP
jgi:hypothetical protein